MDTQQNPQSLKQKIQNTLQGIEEDLSDLVEINGKIQTLEAAKGALKKSLDRAEGEPDTLTEDLKKIEQASQQREEQLKDVDAKIKRMAMESVEKAKQDLDKSGQA